MVMNEKDKKLLDIFGTMVYLMGEAVHERLIESDVEILKEHIEEFKTIIESESGDNHE